MRLLRLIDLGASFEASQRQVQRRTTRGESTAYSNSSQIANEDIANGV